MPASPVQQVPNDHKSTILGRQTTDIVSEMQSRSSWPNPFCPMTNAPESSIGVLAH